MSLDILSLYVFSRIWCPITVCCFIFSYSSSVNFPGLFNISSGIPTFPMSCNVAATPISSIVFCCSNSPVLKDFSNSSNITFMYSCVLFKCAPVSLLLTDVKFTKLSYKNLYMSEISLLYPWIVFSIFSSLSFFSIISVSTNPIVLTLSILLIYPSVLVIVTSSCFWLLTL